MAMMVKDYKIHQEKSWIYAGRFPCTGFIRGGEPQFLCYYFQYYSERELQPIKDIYSCKLNHLKKGVQGKLFRWYEQNWH